MPMTSLSQQFFNNIGPLTTTFTAPASCATATNNVILSVDTGRGIPFGLDCNTKTSTLGSCFPSGSAIDAQYAAFSGSPLRQQQINYFSPGLACPHAWVTAGVAAKDGSSSLSSTGVFTSTSVIVYNNDFIDFPRPNILMSALNPGETAILCCPTGFTAEQDACVSTLPSHAATTGCGYLIPGDDYTFIPTTVTVGGSTVTANIFSLTATSPVTGSWITSFSPEEATHWAAVSYLPMVTLVHQQSDVPKTSSTVASSTTKISTSSAQNTAGLSSSGGMVSGSSSTNLPSPSRTAAPNAAGRIRTLSAANLMLAGLLTLASCTLAMV